MSCDTLMVLGTTSGCGKSFLVAGLCRWFARQGLRVTPFKSQNMSNHARVVNGLLEGTFGEIGTAQYFQALAAEVVPDVRMNPILLKPQAVGCEVVVFGAVSEEVKGVPWRMWNEVLWPHAQRAIASLRAEYNLVLIEGMGSPAEINLNDIANMRTANEANAKCLLVVDIDRGGAFAHLIGTFLLLTVSERARICGFVINRFRGDPALLQKGIAALREHTGVPTVAIIPFVDFDIPAEDSLFLDKPLRQLAYGAKKVAIIAYPHMSNADEFDPLLNRLDIDVQWARSASEIEQASLIILPGSKDTTSDLKWIKDNGLSEQILNKATAQNVLILGICGGFQILGDSIQESNEPAPHRGLSLLPLTTQLRAEKTLRRVTITTLDSQSPLQGYEIHRGYSEMISKEHVEPFLVEPDGTAAGWRRGNVFGTYVHGLFENEPFRHAFIGVESSNSQINIFEKLADLVDQHFDTNFLSTFLPKQ